MGEARKRKAEGETTQRRRAKQLKGRERNIGGGKEDLEREREGDRREEPERTAEEGAGGKGERRIQREGHKRGQHDKRKGLTRQVEKREGTEHKRRHKQD